MAEEAIEQLSDKLRLAASKGQIEYIRELVAAGAQFIPDKYGRTALHYAANYGQVKAAKLCIYLGCELDTQDTYGCTALNRAVIDNHLDTVKALLLEGCAVDRQDENGNTALHEAAWTGYEEIVVALVKHGNANLGASNKHGNKPLHQSCQNGHNGTTRILLRAGSHVSTKNKRAETPLHIAALFGHITCCRILISANCKVNVRNVDGCTALHVAAGLGKKKISMILIEAASDLAITDNNGNTALELARKNDHVEVVMLVLAAMKLQSKSTHHHHRHRSKSPHKLPSTSHKPEAKQEVNSQLKHKKTVDKTNKDLSTSRVRGRREVREQEQKKKGVVSHSHHSKKDGETKRNILLRQAAQSRKLASSSRHNTVPEKKVSFVKEELSNRIMWEQQLHQHIHRVDDASRHQHKHKHHQKCLYKDDKGHVTKGVMPNHLPCSLYIHKLTNQLEASKEKMLSEIDTTKAQFEHQLINLDKKLTHQGSCLEQLCKERLTAERTECLHRIDRRVLRERALWSEEYERRLSYVRDELRRYFEVRLRAVQQQLASYYPPSRRPLHGNPSVFDRISEGNEDSSNSERETRSHRSTSDLGPSSRIIARRRRSSASPGGSRRTVSADGRLGYSQGVNDATGPYPNGRNSYEGSGIRDDEGHRVTVPDGSTIRTGSFTREIHQGASSSPHLHRADESCGSKELVSAVYIPPIVHPDLPQSSHPRKPPDSEVIAASFDFGTDLDSEEDSSSSSSGSTCSFQTVSRRCQTPQGKTASSKVEGLPTEDVQQPIGRLSRITLEQKAQYEEDSWIRQRHEQSPRVQDSQQRLSSLNVHPMHSSSAYSVASSAGASIRNEHHKSASPDSQSHSSQYSPQPSRVSNSSSGISSGDAATTTGSSTRSRRNPIDDVLIRALVMEQRQKDDAKRATSNSQEQTGVRSARSKHYQPAPQPVRCFLRSDKEDTGGEQSSKVVKKTHQLQI